MKKIIAMAALVVLVFSALALTACGGSSNASSSATDYSDSKYVGTGKPAELTLKDQSGEFDGEWTIVLNADGSGQSIDEEGTTDFTWKPTNDGFKTKGDSKLTFTDEGDNIKTKILGVNVIFEKQA